MSLKSKIKRRAGKYKEGLINTLIYKSYSQKIEEDLVYLESRDGNDFTGNIFRIAEELSTGKYGNYRIHVYAKPNVLEKIEKLKENYDLDIHEITPKESTATQYLERAKYIFTDSGIRPKFIKRPGQIMLNTWHGTPLKVMGVRNVPEEYRIGSMQHTFFDADYLLYPNDFMCDVMLSGYMIDKTYPGKALLEGYPRNSVFFDIERQAEFKRKFGYDDKKVFVYMPTYRGTILQRKDSAQKDEIEEYLTQIDNMLTDDQVLLVKLHVFNHSRIDFSTFSHVKSFPEGYEVYDIINMADALITDYSSVFFDFAVSKRKIIIFNYDEEEYLKDRDIYFPISDLPFPKVQNAEDLVNELNSPLNYDADEFFDMYCTYECSDAAERICREIFNGEDLCNYKEISNSNPNILIYVGSLEDDNVYVSLLDNLSQIDLKNNNVFLSFGQWESNFRQNHESIFESLPDDVYVLPLRGKINPTLSEKDDYDRLKANKGNCSPKLDVMFERELKRYYHEIKYDTVINFDGTDPVAMCLYKNFTARKVLFLRNEKINQKLLKQIVPNYDYIITDSEESKKIISSYTQENTIKVNANIRDLI